MNTLKTKILIADDNPVYREVGRDALEHAGFAVTAVCDGAQAIAALAAEKFHAAAVDLTMPEADGIAVISTARADGPNVNTPIVVITGHDEASAVERAYNAGATSFLTKPINWLLFTHHMNFILRNGQLETQLREATQAAAFLSDLKGQMLCALAREFQAPIKTIYGFAELVRREVYGPLAPASYRELVLDMGTAAHKLNSSFLKLMDLGNALNEQLDIKNEVIAVRETLRDLLISISDEAERRRVHVVSTVDIPSTLALRADRVLFIQAVRAVLANAVRLAPRNSQVFVHAWVDENDGLKIAASDTGPAIAASLLAEITNRSRNEPNVPMIDTQTREVGMKIAKVLTEAHQGSIDAHSDGENSNIVRINLPASRLSFFEPEPRTPQPAAKAQDKRLAEISAALAQDPRVRFAKADAPAMAARQLSEDKAAVRDRIPPHSNPG